MGLRIEIVGDASNLRRTLRMAEGDLHGFQGTVSRAGGAISSALRTAGLAVGAAAAAGVVLLGKSVFDAAQNLDTIRNKSKAVFGDSVTFVEQWATNTARSLFMTRAEATNLATSLGDILIPMGYSTQAAAALATEATELTGALARWDSQQRGTAVASEAISDALLGEFERLKEYGVILDQTTLDELMRANGLDHLEGTARRQAEAEVILEEVNRQSASAVRNLSDEELTLRDRTTLASITFQEMRDKLADVLLPKLQDFMDWVNEHAPEIEATFTNAMAGMQTFIDEKLIPAFNAVKDWWMGDEGAAFRTAVSGAFDTAGTSADGARQEVVSFKDVMADTTAAIEGGNRLAAELTRIQTAANNTGLAMNQGFRDIWNAAILSIMGWLTNLVVFWSARAIEILGIAGNAMSWLPGWKDTTTRAAEAVRGFSNSAVADLLRIERNLTVDVDTSPGQGKLTALYNEWNGKKLSWSLAAEASGVGRRGYGDGPGPSAGVTSGWRNMWNAVSGAFPGSRLISGFRPGARTVSGNKSYHSMGRAVDLTPSMAIFNWIKQNFPQSRELIFSPAGAGQVNNGRPHFYTGAIRNMHWDHVHWALERGGLVRRRPGGIMANIGEGRHDEIVSPVPTLRQTITEPIIAALGQARGFVVNQYIEDRSGDPVETARWSAMKLREAM